MNAVKLTLLRTPGNRSEHLDRFDELRFIDELAPFCACPVSVVEMALADVEAIDGFVLFRTSHSEGLLDGVSSERRVALAQKLVPIGDSKSTNVTLAMLERFSFPAAIRGGSFDEWERAHLVKMGHAGIFGVRQVGERIGVTNTFLGSERYCFFDAPDVTVPELLARYLSALQADQAG